MSAVPVQASSGRAGDDATHAFAEQGGTPWEPFTHWKLTRTDAPDLDVYVARRAAAGPTLMLLPGSKCLPLFWILAGRRLSPLFLQGAVPDMLQHANVVAFDRRGLRSFGPPPASEDEVRELARCTPTHGGVSKLERVDDAADVAAALAQQSWTTDVWLLGHSEGADVATGVARRLGSRIGAVALFGGAGLTRFFDEAVLARRAEGSAGVVDVFDGLLAVTGDDPPEELHEDPVVTALTYAVESTPLDDMRSTRVPVFVAHCDGDERVPVEVVDAFVAELLRERTRAVRYVMLQGCDHGFLDADGNDRAPLVLPRFFEWANGRVARRGVEAVPAQGPESTSRSLSAPK